VLREAPGTFCRLLLLLRLSAPVSLLLRLGTCAASVAVAACAEGCCWASL
jgi:hypothetical protein